MASKPKGRQRRQRTAPGVYTIEPNDPNKHFTTPAGAIFWKIGGKSMWGERYRKRAQSWAAAIAYRDEWEKADKKYLETNRQVVVPSVIVSKELSEEVLAQATRAYHKLPKLEGSHTVDPRYTLDDGIQFALKCGWNPTLGSVKVKELLPELLAYQEWRTKLDWRESGQGRYITKATFINHKRSIKHCGLIFGEETLSTINSKPRQQAILDALGDVTLEHKQCACAGLCLLLKWLKDSGRLGQAAVNCFRVRVTAKAVPEVMSIIQQQEYLDAVWRTKWAATGVARLFLGVRPWSELKKSKSDSVAYGLAPDCRTFFVPIDGKTGWRPVRCSPIATLLFEELKKEGRLFKTIDANGNMVLDHASTRAWTSMYARIGYRVGAGSLRDLNRSAKGRAMSDDELVKYFRKFYPEKYPHEFVKDYPRHTSISAFVESSLGEIDKAATHFGNSRIIINKNYRGRMSLAAAIVHYRLLPTGLKGKYKPEDIPLPPWCQVAPDKLSEADLKEMLALYASLPRFDPTVDYTSRSRTAMEANSRSEAVRRRWAEAKARSTWPEERAKLAKKVAEWKTLPSKAAPAPEPLQLPLQAA
jgi:hypothetical protein